MSKMECSKKDTVTRVCKCCGEARLITEFALIIATKGYRVHKCRLCLNEYRKKHRQKNRDRINEQRRSQYGAEDSRRKNTERELALRWKFGISSEQYDKMLAEQAGVCAICKKTSRDGTRLCVDHCHKTGMIRGLLCRNCNSAIGQLGDELEGVLQATLYLARTTEKKELTRLAVSLRNGHL